MFEKYARKRKWPPLNWLGRFFIGTLPIVVVLLSISADVHPLWSIAHNFLTIQGPQCPNAKVSASGSEGSRFETRFHRRSALYSGVIVFRYYTGNPVFSSSLITEFQ
ncbi:hypothetical protein AVEN_100844-1 [Araneus ventricosus]|uniref:Uncharacterized protein n=1 Tax=Araneus ventricosus TaxID=182803 RepID=A0A4Y2AW56_ARAVE|nr:hypothetical protein AVEN_100844-1 [Araneus ventricosus]